MRGVVAGENCCAVVVLGVAEGVVSTVPPLTHPVRINRTEG